MNTIKKKILITGGNGQLAFDLKHIKSSLFECHAPTRQELDVTQLSSIKAAIKYFKPDFVINTAAYTQVDRAEKEVQRVFAVNRDGAKYIAMACEEFHRPLIHLSTDYIFDGKSNQPYQEDDKAVPINKYGLSKLEGEQAIQKYCEKYIILRVSAVFGVHGSNFVKSILRLAKEREQLQIIEDQVTCPTPSATIADILFKIIENPQWGVFHYCGEQSTSWYNFACNIIDEAKQYDVFALKEIKNIPSKDFPTLATRPQFSILNCDKFKASYQLPQPQWQKGLSDVIKSLYTA